MYDVVIIGAGPGGMSAGIYAVRSGLKTLIVEKFMPGGQVVNTADVENYPGFEDPISGFELSSAMDKQVRRLGVTIESREIVSVERDEKRDILVCTDAKGEQIESKAVIAATGSKHKQIGVPGETEFTGKGVSYCATCDGAFFKDKVTVVIGGGNTALDEALFLTRFASKVYLVHRRDKFRASQILVDRVLQNEKVQAVYNSVIETINGEVKVEGVTLKSTVDGTLSELKTDGVFIFIGYNPVTGMLPDSVKNEWGEVKTDIQMMTPVSGLYAVGDIREDSRKQIVTAAADGANAAMAAYEYITHEEL